MSPSRSRARVSGPLVEQRAVTTLQVFGLPRVAGRDEAQVAARQRGVGHCELATGIAAERVLDGFETNRATIPRAVHHDQARHVAMMAWRRT